MKPLIIDSEITLIPYYPNYDTALPWYQDLDVCRQVDNIDCTYSLERLQKMYSFIRKYALLYAKTFKISGLEDAVS